jgi:hypothetical protein
MPQVGARGEGPNMAVEIIDMGDEKNYAIVRGGKLCGLPPILKSEKWKVLSDGTDVHLVCGNKVLALKDLFAVTVFCFIGFFSQQVFDTWFTVATLAILPRSLYTYV